MTIYATPGNAFPVSAQAGSSGLVGTIGVRIRNPATSTDVMARTTAGITEQPAGSSLYFATPTAPTLGSYSVIWDDGAGTFNSEDLVVTATPPERLQPDGPFETSLASNPGLVGTLGVRIRDIVANTDIVARTTAGITEQPAGSGTYFASLTAPTTPGASYAVIWDDAAGAFAAETITLASAGIPSVPGHIRVKVATDGDSDGFVVGEIAQFDADFYTNRALTDAGDVTLTIRPPNGPEAAPDLTFGPTSHALAQYLLAHPGWHDWRMESAGALIAVQQGRFRVSASNV